MAGFCAQAAVRRTPVLLDGLVVTAAALVAEQLAPETTVATIMCDTGMKYLSKG